MKCPICSKEMEITSSTTYSREFKEYSRKTYHCVDDDVWVVLEIPKSKLKELS